MNNNQQQINQSDIEDCIIGAMLLADDFDELAEIIVKCHPSGFSGHHAVTTYATISTMASKGIHAKMREVFRVADEIGFSNSLMGGMEYLAHCVCECSSSKDADKYIAMLDGILLGDEEWRAWASGKGATAKQICIDGISRIISTVVEKHLSQAM